MTAWKRIISALLISALALVGAACEEQDAGPVEGEPLEEEQPLEEEAGDEG